ncbi:four-carbon acid sugar kinase family protein [Neorhizobium petrolearium]|uniref:four-carbon acid sugar kinase family protein n=1 Tax=Neorhizobium petrolearium TaxID=515361 RepID=UPI003F18B7EB
MIAILADDLTGALDSAAPFAGRGKHTEVALNPDVIPLVLQDRPDVLAINLACRELHEDAAREAAARAISMLPPGTSLFKKIDSRLKGHIAAELDATPFDRALVAPAIPEFGRFVAAGCLEGFGVDKPISIREKLGRHASRAIIPDIRSAADMDEALQTAQATGVDLLIGARGLADALARGMTGRAEAVPAEIPAGAALFVIGSRDPITLAQIDELRRSYPVHCLQAPNGMLAETSIGGTGITLVQATPGTEARSPQEVSEALAAGIAPSLTDTAKTLLLSGGATADAVLRRMGISRLRLIGECLPGLGLAYAGGQCIIAKSGGFGGPDTLTSITSMILRKAG